MRKVSKYGFEESTVKEKYYNVPGEVSHLCVKENDFWWYLTYDNYLEQQVTHFTNVGTSER